MLYFLNRNFRLKLDCDELIIRAEKNHLSVYIEILEGYVCCWAPIPQFSDDFKKLICERCQTQLAYVIGTETSFKLVKIGDEIESHFDRLQINY